MGPRAGREMYIVDEGSYVCLICSLDPLMKQVVVQGSLEGENIPN